MESTTKCLVCDLRGDHDTEECPYIDGLFEEESECCDGCGERYDESRPNAGDGWAEMGDPADLAAETFTGHYQCGLARGLELA